MKHIFKYMEIPCETWESTGQIHIEFDSRGEGKVA